MRRARLALAAIGVAMAMTACGDQGGTTEVHDVRILTGPRFWTGDPARPWADALAVVNGRIQRLLTREELGREVAVGATVATLPGAVAVPGLTDAHGHIVGYGLSRRRADLRGARTVDEALARIASYAAQHPDDPWILGRGWDQNDWPGKAWPDADQLERVTGGRPCLLSRVDGHAAWVNRAALRLAGVDARTPDPPGGTIHRDGAGEPTGILVDAATEIVEKAVPPPSDAAIEDALEIAGRELTALGLTGAHEMGTDRRRWEAMRRLAADGRFPLRVTAYADAGTDLQRDLEKSGPQQQGRLRLVGIKFYADGALGSRGARLLAPYADAPGQLGLWLTPPEKLQADIRAARERGLQPAVHAIGDAANRAVLDALDGSAGALARLRVEHVQVLDPADIARFASADVVASMQPTHATSDRPWAGERLGPSRVAGAYAWGALLHAGAHLAFGSDFPVELPDPRLGLYAAVTRQDLDGDPPGGWMPDQRLSLEQALAAFTSGAAWAAQQEGELGRLAPGYWCDLTVFERDPFAAAPDDIPEIPVAAVVIAGQNVASRVPDTR
ncbi:MAG: amidohydrolase [Acidobacteria bacterium]|nr:amidohydrolase [Acidobacteriota bacterium]